MYRSIPFPCTVIENTIFALNFIFDSEMPLKYLPKSPSSQIVKQNEPSENFTVPLEKNYKNFIF